MTNTFTVTLTEKHHLEANRLHFWSGVKSKKFIWALLRLTVLYLAIAIAATYLNRGSLNGANWIEIVLIGTVGGSAVLILCYIIGYATLSRRSKRLFEQQKMLHDPAEYSVSDHALHAKTKLSEIALPFGHALKWLENGNFFLIYHTDNSFQILPAEFVPTEMLGHIRAKLVAAGCPGRRL
jgi:hypothetical protein